ncbi:MAG TPA: bifunctional diaminohydroxyphosphoribosylaminopyrimidine deaminase/5-amino-6-(5-phosphoribosylamino)uracil reductase RibD [Terriglobales bacterium]|nr:bifunctional diaminohydroxyphosphoribosylaminopyrimidine deaminase/5-amino-6-(5-phosphoribosylamino)uracil reductase RibD [Terriglobales bacterium]
MYRLNDLDFMREALRLAGEGTGLASPNPRVGAVVVRDGQIVGRGTHWYDRKDHAEALALAEAGERARGATLYLNLEPCCHFGRTPPCVQAIVAAGVARVVAGMRDPNPQVAGEGFRQLQAAGIAVESDCLGREARQLNEDFSTWIRHGRPFVTLKAAVSLDGRIAAPAVEATPAASPPLGPEPGPAERRWISSTPSRERVQQMRHQSDAVLTGIGTLRADDPLLTDRTKRPRRRPLLRVVLDSHLRLPVGAQLLKAARRHHDVLVFCVQGEPERQAALEKAGARVERVAADALGRVDLEEVLRRLGGEAITSILLEAGAQLNGAMLAGGWVDKLVLFQAPRLLGAGGVALTAGGAALPRHPQGALACESVGPDVMITSYLAE